MVRKVTKYGESVVHRKTKPVNFAEVKKYLPNILKDMFDTCSALKGVGLSANQIGLDLRLAVIIIGERENEKRLVIINPRIVESSHPAFEQEGCLSVPGIYARTKRFDKVKLEASNEKGMPVEINATGLLARVIQHEMDHLNGRFFIDRLSAWAKIKAKSYIKKVKPYWKKTDESKGIFYEGPFFGNT